MQCQQRDAQLLRSKQSGWTGITAILCSVQQVIAIKHAFLRGVYELSTSSIEAHPSGLQHNCALYYGAGLHMVVVRVLVSGLCI